MWSLVTLASLFITSQSGFVRKLVFPVNCASPSVNLTGYGLGIQSFNLRPLFLNTGYYEVQDPTTKVTYYFNICGNINPPSFCSTPKNGPWNFVVADPATKTCKYGVAAWNTGQVVFGTKDYYMVIAMPDNNSSQPYFSGIEVLSLTKDTDPNNPPNCSTVNYDVNVNYNIYCISGADPPTHLEINQTATCAWNITMYSKFACLSPLPAPVNPGGLAPEPEPLSGGAIFVIVVCVVAILYLIFGCAYNSFVHGRVGLEAIPNKGFWVNMGRYVVAGCQYSSDVCCPCLAGKSGTYEQL